MKTCTMILSAFASLIPLMEINDFLGAYATDSIVWNPASSSFLMSEPLIPFA